MGGALTTQLGSHSSWMMTRHLPVSGSAATNSMNVLPAIGAVEEQLFAVGRPGHLVDVMADHGVLKRLAVADVDGHCRFGLHVINEKIGDGIGRRRALG